MPAGVARRHEPARCAMMWRTESFSAPAQLCSDVRISAHRRAAPATEQWAAVAPGRPPVVVACIFVVANDDRLADESVRVRTLRHGPFSTPSAIHPAQLTSHVPALSHPTVDSSSNMGRAFRTAPANNGAVHEQWGGGFPHWLLYCIYANGPGLKRRESVAVLAARSRVTCSNADLERTWSHSPHPL